MAVKGFSADRFTELRSFFQQRINSGDDLGAAIAVNIDGRHVVDIWGGYTSADCSQPWEKDTIVNIWSSTKTIISFAILILVDRGLLGVNENVAKYWPEFAANGKENVKVRHLLSHTSGLSGWETPVALQDIYDFEKAASLLAEQAPWWEPGTASGYHALTMGYLLGELVFRVTGKTMNQFIAKEIAQPLNVDIQIGVKEEDWSRVAVLAMATGTPTVLREGTPQLILKTIMNPGWNAADAMTPGWRAADVSAVNGHSNARALSKIMSAIALGGEVDGVRLLKPETIELVFLEQAHGIDVIIGRSVQFGIGYGLCTAGDTTFNEVLPKGKICFWSGWGGSIVVADTERRMSFSYVMNKMQTGHLPFGNPNTAAYVKMIYKALGVSLGN